MNDSKICYDIPNDSAKTTYVKASAILIVGAVGILGNAFIIVLSFKYATRRNLTHLIISMAVADILVAVMWNFFFAAPLLGFKYFFVNTNIAILDDIMCRSLKFLRHTAPSVTLSSLLVISIERFKATSSTMQVLRQYTTKSRLIILGCCCWGLPMLFSAFGLFATVKKNKKKRNVCNIIFAGVGMWRNLQICITMVVYLVILTLTIISLKRLQRPLAIIAHMSQNQARARMKRNSRSVKMVLFSLLIYTTYFPFTIYRLGSNALLSKAKRGNVCFDWKKFLYVIEFLPLINSCLSPFVYLTFLTDYQRGAKKLLCGCFIQRKNRITNQNTQSTQTESEVISRKNTMEEPRNLGNDDDDSAL